MYLRCIPLKDPTDWMEVLDAGKKKELSATQGEKYPVLQYPFFGTRSDCFNFKMHHLYPSRPGINMMFRARLSVWKKSVSSLLLIPHPSPKTIGEHSSIRFNEVVFSGLDWYHIPRNARTSEDLERYYMETGIMMDGPSEVRYAWLYNDLKPRIYYAQGSSAYFACRYIATPLDRLAAMFRSTNPKTRYSFAHFGTVDFQSEVFMIYDYKSFTTLLADFKGFMHHLALYCMDTTVRVFDTHTGVQEVNLGQMLKEYNDVCNSDPEFSIHRIEGVDSDHPRCLVHHRIAGMLGVYGNIVGSTILHGISTISIVGTEDNVNTIGDDAGIKIQLEELSVEETLECINVIGEVAAEKAEMWKEDQTQCTESVAWHYTKRPVTVETHIIKQSWMPDFPILARILAVVDGQHTNRPEDFNTRRRLLIKQSCRLLDSMHRNLLFVSELDILTVLDLLKRMYARMRMNAHGSFPRKWDKRDPLDTAKYADEYLCIPPLVVDSVVKGWFSVLKETRRESCFVLLPDCDTPSSIPTIFETNVVFHARGSKLLGVMESLNVICKETVREEWFLDDEVIEKFEQLIRRERFPVYKYTCMMDYPQWSSQFDSSSL